MKTYVAMLVLVITILSRTPAHAREPFESEWRPSPPPAAPAPDPFAFVVPAGLYYVTDTYVGDVVAMSGATTTYSTTTVHESTGTYARVSDTVDTGAYSAFDGQAFNGRGALTDGRALAGTYYENFVLTTDGYVPVSIVFFQDDSETRRRGVASSPAPASSPTPASAAPSITSAPAVVAAASRAIITPTPSLRPKPPIAPAGPTLRAGIALASDGPTLASAEVLRGRMIQFWPRAFANDVAVPIRSWRLLSAQPDRISASSGSVEPLAAQWIRMPAPGVRWWLRFEIFTELAPTERLEAEISITVRSPALID
ncbi:MAG: hypothetical protein ACRDF9_14355 [Candidatus Limnocylindria bacterium]